MVYITRVLRVARADAPRHATRHARRYAAYAVAKALLRPSSTTPYVRNALLPRDASGRERYAEQGMSTIQRWARHTAR